MPDALKILLNAQIRHWLLILLGGAALQRFGFADQVLDYLRNTNLDYVTMTLAAAASVWGVWSRWRSKRNQKLALQLPAGTPEHVLKEVAAEQPLSSVLKATPAPLLLLALGLPCLFFTSCADTTGRIDGYYKDARGNKYGAGYEFSRSGFVK